MLEVMVTMLGALTIISINGSILDDFALYGAGDGGSAWFARKCATLTEVGYGQA